MALLLFTLLSLVLTATTSFGADLPKHDLSTVAKVGMDTTMKTCDNGTKTHARNEFCLVHPRVIRITMTTNLHAPPQDAMITLAGYQAETHKVITPDGYILTLYRLVRN